MINYQQRFYLLPTTRVLFQLVLRERLEVLVVQELMVFQVHLVKQVHLELLGRLEILAKLGQQEARAIKVQMDLQVCLVSQEFRLQEQPVVQDLLVQLGKQDSQVQLVFLELECLAMLVQLDSQDLQVVKAHKVLLDCLDLLDPMDNLVLPVLAVLRGY